MIPPRQYSHSFSHQRPPNTLHGKRNGVIRRCSLTEDYTNMRNNYPNYHELHESNDTSQPKETSDGRSTRPTFLIMILIAITHSCVMGIAMSSLPAVLFCMEDIVRANATLVNVGTDNESDYRPDNGTVNDVAAETSHNNVKIFERLSHRNGQNFPMDIFEDRTVVGSLIAAFSWGQPVLCFGMTVVTFLLGSSCHDGVYFKAVLLQGILTLLIPISFNYSYELVAMIRLAQGILAGIAGGLLPSLCSKYGSGLGLASALLVASTSLSRIAGLLPMVLSGALCDDNKWTTNFYIFGPGTIFFAGLCLLVTGKYQGRWAHTRRKRRNKLMDNHPANLCYTESTSFSTGMMVCLKTLGNLAKTYSIYALCLSGFSCYCITIFMNIFLPKYFSDVFGMPLTVNRWYIIWPPMIASVSNLLVGTVASSLESRCGGIRSMKIIHGLSTVPPSILLLVMVFTSGLQPSHVLVLQCVTFVFLVNTNLSTYHCATLAYSPPVSILASGLVYTWIALSYIFVPYIVEITTATGSPESWIPSIVLFVALMLASSLAYMFIKSENISCATIGTNNLLSKLNMDNGFCKRDDDTGEDIEKRISTRIGYSISSL